MLSDSEGGRALDRVLDRRERGEPGFTPRKDRANKWSVAFLLFAFGVFLVAVSSNGQKIEPRHGAAFEVQKKN